MKVKQLKDIMEEVNEPNEFTMQPFDLYHPYYWIWVVKNVRIKTLFSQLEPKRKTTDRFDVFINGLFIRKEDYNFEQIVNDFYIKFKRKNFPTLDRFGNSYEIEVTDKVKIKGDLENVK